ncbi:hypothetical protein [Synechocystis sp. PCC 7509]|uniref:hypothetical protein n=1 Tax=Synechocystis sp. PCC 7509 TaxID=927677 RepID=UPI0002ACB769|nr:hypothetical protein [Synechocystis sp. PCC 7509]
MKLVTIVTNIFGGDIIVRKAICLGLAGIIGAASLGVTPVAFAKRGDIIKTGVCTAKSTWKLKVSPDDDNRNNPLIETEFEVDQNRNGQRWSVVIRRDRTPVFRSNNVVTQAPSGSFSINSRFSNPPGQNIVTAMAANPATGEKCQATIAVTF